MPTTNLLTPQETSELLRVSPKTLTRWRYFRQGPPFLKLGRAVRYSRDDLDRYLAGSRVSTISQKFGSEVVE